MKVKIHIDKYRRDDGTPVTDHNKRIDKNTFLDKAEFKPSKTNDSFNTKEPSYPKKDISDEEFYKALAEEEAKTSKEYKAMGLNSFSKDEAKHSKFFDKKAKEQEREQLLIKKNIQEQNKTNRIKAQEKQNKSYAENLIDSLETKK